MMQTTVLAIRGRSGGTDPGSKPLCVKGGCRHRGSFLIAVPFVRLSEGSSSYSPSLPSTVGVRRTIHRDRRNRPEKVCRESVPLCRFRNDCPCNERSKKNRTSRAKRKKSARSCQNECLPTVESIVFPNEETLK